LRDDAAGGAFRPVRDEPAGPRAGRGDTPSGVFTRPVVPPPARAAIEPPPPTQTTDARGGRRRARAEDEPAGTGRRAAEAHPSESYDHGPALVPIIKPLADYTPPATTTEPPPLVPIFPTMRPDSSPTSGSATGRRARRAAEEPEPPASGARRRFDEAAGRSGPHTGELGAAPGAFRRDDTGVGRRARPELPSGAPFTEGGADPGRRGAVESPTSGRRGRDIGTPPAAGTDTGTGRRSRGTEDPVAFRRPAAGSGSGPATGSGFGPATGSGPAAGSGLGPATGSGFGPATGSGFGPASGAGLGPASGAGYGPASGAGFGAGAAGGRGADAGRGTGRRGGFYTGAPDDTSTLRRDGTGALRRDDTTGVRRDDTGTGRRGGFDDVPGRRDDTGTARRRRDGFEPIGLEPTGFDRTGAGFDRTGAGYEPSSAAFEASGTATRRRPAADDAPHQRRPLDDGLPFDEPTGTGRRGGRGRGTGEYTGTGTQRALREPSGKRPAGRPDDRRPGRLRPSTAEPVRVEQHRPHRWIAALSVIGVIVLLAACGLGSWFIFKDEKNGPDSARSSATAGPKKRDISSRQVDPNPLTEAEVFPQNNIVAAVNEPPYVILKTQASPDCKTAATDELANLLAGAGCSEVVRATMKSPNEEYLITAGIFNLDTEKAAATAFAGVKPIVDGQKGRFAGMSVGAGTGTDAIVRAPTQLGWNYRGHFIAFVVIARVDGKEFLPDDQYPNQITYDIVETYLENEIIGNRAIIQPDATPAASLPVVPPS
jgi:hypothetical protein